MKAVAPFAVFYFLCAAASAQFPNPVDLPPVVADDPPPRRAVDADKELMVLDPAVVDSERASYPGAFSIGHLFDELAGEEGDGRVLMREWLESWEVRQQVNGDLVAARPKIRQLVIEPWQEADGWLASSGNEWLPNFDNAPFRLLGIVNRLDLGNLAPVYYGGSGVTSEGRLVFGGLDQAGKPLDHHFTVIFEYKMLGGGDMTKTEIARQWHALGDHAEFDEAYLEALEVATRRFTDRPHDKEGKQLASGLAQIRTNEMAFAKTCEMREFKLDEKKLALALEPVAQTPREEFGQRGTDEHRALHGYLTKNKSAVIGGRRSLPKEVSDHRGKKIPFLAGSCTIPDPKFYWETGGVRTRELRQVFSRRTCNGCHARDTETDFCHIRPRLAGERSEVSKFLAMVYEGHTVEDPGDRFATVTTTEMRDRIEDFLKTIHPRIDRPDLKRLVRRSFSR